MTKKKESTVLVVQNIKISASSILKQKGQKDG